MSFLTSSSRPLLAALLAGGALATVPAVAGASATASFDGQTIHVAEGSPGEVNHVTVATQESGVIEISDQGAAVAGAGCQPKETEPTTVQCPAGPGGIEVATGGGDDSVGTYVGTLVTPIADGALRVDLGPGNDRFLAGDAAEVVNGGEGNDDLKTGKGNDVVDGGGGDDTIEAGEGADAIRGGDGADHIAADPFSDAGIWGDAIDGGPGADILEDYKHTGGEQTAPAVAISLDGAANDGRPGEGDNVTAVERIESWSAGTFTGDDDANTFIAPETGAAGTYSGRGGADRLFAGDASGDALDGGAGDDELSGGFGDDTLTGGPGRDTIAGDRPGRCNEIHCDIGGGFGNDTIEARDGEVDSIACGPGADTVRADAADVVAADCETVDRAAAPGGPGTPGGGTTTKKAKVTLKVASTKSIKKLLAGGLVVRVTGAKAGATVKATLVVGNATARKLKLTRGRKSVAIASGSAKGAKAGATTSVKLRFSAASRKRLRHAKRVTASLRVTGASARTLKLGR